MKEDFPIFVKWMEITDWVLDRAEKMPKAVRFTISGRIANLTLDVMEGIIEAIYTKDRKPLLNRINLQIEKLRILFRITHQRQYISTRQYEYISTELNEAGKMIGGWRRT